MDEDVVLLKYTGSPESDTDVCVLCTKANIALLILETRPVVTQQLRAVFSLHATP